LPDESAVLLNANTSIHYARVNWSSDRSVHLIGEAYFKVTKGNHFTVRTDLGNVTVLGTEFNVVNRRGIFEVMCYEGSVSVSSDHNEIILTPGEGYRLINGSPLQLKTITTAPTWIENESSFNQWPLHFVLDELERQYDIRIDDSQIDSQQSFTGSFTHTNLELALKTVLTPFDLTYTKEQNQIVLVRE
jgi:transmembrane sensor